MSVVGEKLDVAILGSGNIGCDLLAKVIKSPFLNCALFVGRRENSPGISFARGLKAPVSCNSTDAIIDRHKEFDVVINASTAKVARQYASTFENLKLRQLDVTPSALGAACVPIINGDEMLFRNYVNFVSCGAQATLPIIHALKRAECVFNMVEVIVSASSDTIGLGTRENIDEYLLSTERAIKTFSNALQTKAILNIANSEAPPNMKVTILVKLESYDLAQIKNSIDAIMSKIHMSIMRTYRIVLGPDIDNGRLVISIEIVGAGDFLPKYAGNLDIITRNAIYYAECIAQMNMVRQLCA